MSEEQNILESVGIQKTFRDIDGSNVLALSNISVDVRRSEFVSVVGPSGCGKSTFLRIVAGLEAPTGGMIKVSGREISGPGADRGMVFQEYALLPWKTTLANVAFGLQLRGMPRAKREGIAQRYIDLVGISGFENKYPHQLSGGMRQRAAVARALANSPTVLLMDEPFAAIDAITRRRLQEELTEISAAEKMTVLFVTHSIEEAIFLSDRVIAFSARPGRVVRELKVDMPRPRRWEQVVNLPAFVQMRDELLEIFRGDGASSKAQEHV